MRGLLFLRRSLGLHCREYGKPDKRETHDASFAYIGEGESLSYLEELYFNRSKIETSATISLLSLTKAVGHLISEDRFIFVEIDRLLSFLIPRDFLLTFPWIRQKVRLKGDAYLARKQKISATFGRKVRKYGYTSRMTRDRRAVLRFYDKFYVPYISSRFQELCFLRSIREFQSAVESGFLLQVYDGKRWVSGAICQVRGKSISVLAFGVHSQHMDLLKHGVLSSAYYFIFDWSEKAGLETVDLLRSRAHAADGVYEHKRRWGALAEMDPWVHTAIWIFVPESAMIPPMLESQLIWHGDQFLELKSIYT